MAARGTRTPLICYSNYGRRKLQIGQYEDAKNLSRRCNQCRFVPELVCITSGVLAIWRRRMKFETEHALGSLGR
jgi:hypothetical protein